MTADAAFKLAKQVASDFFIRGTDPEDVAQEAALAVCELLMTQAEPTPAAVRDAVRSRIRQQYRKANRRRTRRVVLGDDDSPNMEPADTREASPDANAELAELWDQIRDTLTAGQFAVFELAYRDGLSASQIACRLGLTIHTVESRLDRSRKKCADSDLIDGFRGLDDH